MWMSDTVCPCVHSYCQLDMYHPPLLDHEKTRERLPMLIEKLHTPNHSATTTTTTTT